MENQFKNQLLRDRQADNYPGVGGQAREMMNEGQEMAKAATPTGFISLITKCNPAADWMYGMALIAAIAKDFIDLIEITVFLYLLVLVVTICISIFIWAMVMLASFSEGSKGQMKKAKSQANLMKKGMVLIGGTTVETLFGLNFLPWETITVIILYVMTLSARKQMADSQKNQKNILQYKVADDYNNIPRNATADDYNENEKKNAA